MKMKKDQFYLCSAAIKVNFSFFPQANTEWLHSKFSLPSLFFCGALKERLISASIHQQISWNRNSFTCIRCPEPHPQACSFHFFSLPFLRFAADITAFKRTDSYPDWLRLLLKKRKQWGHLIYSLCLVSTLKQRASQIYLSVTLLLQFTEL